MEPVFSYTVREIPGGQVFAFRGELDLSARHAVAELVTGPPGSLVVVDLHELTFVDSSGLGAIHLARRAMLASGGTLVLTRPQPVVLRVLEMTGLDRWVSEWDPAWSRPSPGPLQPDSSLSRTRRAAS